MQQNRNCRTTNVLSGYRAFAIPCQGSLGQPKLRFQDGLTAIANRILHSDSRFRLDSEVPGVNTRQICAG